MSASPPVPSGINRSHVGNSWILPWLILILITGFLTTSILSYLVSRQAIRDSIAKQTLPLTGDTIYSNIQKDILQPVLISSEMANNTFLRDWLLSGEQDPNDVARYLKAIQEKHDTITAFVASEKTRRYYHPGGLLTTLDLNSPRDTWYARVRNLKEPYETNVGLDSTNKNLPTIYIDYLMRDERGQFLGVTGVGLTLKNLQDLLENYEENFRRNIFFVDREGKFMLTSASSPGLKGHLRDIPGLTGIAPQILESTDAPQSLEYQRDGGRLLVNSRFIPELGWFLVVEQEEDAALEPLKRVLALNLGISALATLLVVLLTIPVLHRYQRRLEWAAHVDGLTGLVNRQAFDLQFAAHVSDARRNRGPFAGVLFDIDHFKSINDQFGHQVGDQVLREVAALTRQTVRASDLVARWGGEEFMILLKNCTLNDAQELAQKLRAAIEQHSFGQPELKVTVSMGVAAYQPGESAENFLLRTDRALYRAKGDGRNRVQVHHDS